MKEEIFKISKDRDRAKDLFDMAKDRLSLLKIIPKNKTYKIIEEYYEVIKEILTAIMYIDGYKTLSHIKLIEYFDLNYKKLNKDQIRLLDQLRRFRIGIVYYGRKIRKEFLDNYEKDIREIIKILSNFLEVKLKKEK